MNVLTIADAMHIKYRNSTSARVAELVDALDLGSSPPERIGVQLPSLASIIGLTVDV